MQDAAFGPPRGQLSRWHGVAGFRSECRGSLCILHVSGSIGIASATELEMAIERISREHRGDVLVSFVRSRFADGTVVRVLLKEYERLGSRLLIVIDTAGRLPRVLEDTSVATRLPLYPTLRAAFLDLSSDPMRSLGDLSGWASR